MEIVREFVIKPVILSKVGPHTIPLETILSDRKCFLAVDGATCAQHGIDLYNLAERILVCRFESYKAALHTAGMLKGEIDEKKLGAGDLFMQSLSKTEKIFSDDDHLHMTYILELETKGMSRHDCPFYHFDLELTWEEYVKCAKLFYLSSTVFRPKFHVARNVTSYGGAR